MTDEIDAAAQEAIALSDMPYEIRRAVANMELVECGRCGRVVVAQKGKYIWRYQGDVMCNTLCLARAMVSPGVPVRGETWVEKAETDTE